MWFKQQYVGPILRGIKTDTIRHPRSRFIPPGTRVSFSVGPRSPFAEAIITACELIPAEDIPEERLRTLHALYGEHPVYQRVAFQVVKVFHKCPEVVKALATT